MRTLRILATVAILAAARGRSFAAGSPKVGEPAPDFSARTLDGRTVTLSELRGRPVLLNFWAPWCAPCRVEAPWLVGIDARYRRRGLVVVGALADESSRSSVEEFVETYRVRYPVVFGAGVAKAYGGAPALPRTFFIDGRGRIVSALVGVEGRPRLESEVRRLFRGTTGIPRAPGRATLALPGPSFHPIPKKRP